MADWREKIKTIAAANGSSAPEGAKKAGIGCLVLFMAAVSILTFIISIGLYRSGNWVVALFALTFFVLSTITAAILLIPHKTDSL
ncbi:hypothetical protein [Planomicrobium soli]|uniref:hypothetical protein n=1 Tax=Planomicrobium soli TaxID=1176648 RepID=UPI000D0D1180|nr:hypothetical protein [Planomicrobium soli]